MTKVFAARAVVLLWGGGRLALDDLAEKYVPELAGWPPVSPDADRVTIRHLLTMTAGCPTDDPWGDGHGGGGVPEDVFIRGRLLAPLGMTRTGFDASEFPADGLAVGYRRGPAGWAE